MSSSCLSASLGFYTINFGYTHPFAFDESVPADVSIIVQSPDPDVLVLLLSFIEHLEQKVIFDTGNKRRLIHAKAVFQKVAGRSMQ